MSARGWSGGGRVRRSGAALAMLMLASGVLLGACASSPVGSGTTTTTAPVEGPKIDKLPTVPKPSTAPTSPDLSTVAGQTTFLNQDQAMRGGSKIPLSQSGDQHINTTFYNLNVQYQLNRSWGIMAMVPYWQRRFTTNANFGATPAQIENYSADALSDVRIEGIYSGFSPDMSTGLIFGLKLPTGTHTATGLDRDTQPGTGTTDVLLGGYKWGNLAPNWSWYAQGIFRSALDSRDGYRPGNSLHLVGAVHYDGFRFKDHVAPMLQVNVNGRLSDSGINSDPANSGLRSVFITPGLLFDLGRHWMANAEIYIPVYYHVTGVQLVPQQDFSFGFTYNM